MNFALLFQFIYKSCQQNDKVLGGQGVRVAAEGQQGSRARPPVLRQTPSTPEPTFPPRRACRTHASGTHAATIL